MVTAHSNLQGVHNWYHWLQRLYHIMDDSMPGMSHDGHGLVGASGVVASTWDLICNVDLETREAASCDLVSVRTGCPWPLVARLESVSCDSLPYPKHPVQNLYPAHQLSTSENGHKNHVQLLTSDVNSPASSSTNSPIRSLEIPADSKPMALWYSVAFGSQCHLS